MTGPDRPRRRAPFDGAPLLLPSFAAVAVTTLLVDAALGWALVELVGPLVLAALVPAALASLVVAWWQNGRTVRTDAGHRAAVAALRSSTDPGPGLRDAATDRARVLLGSPRSDTWLPPALLGGLALACVVAALVRSDVPTALPALPLTALACSFLVRRREQLTRAHRWLSDPPYPEEDHP
ncbi:hypothetical protein [uncultured Modestobacter sp.]|uniref:hypothetical protein n=1 Tax=uncultured Modestobacter sp. TaxID=380048 RepID=UPI00261DE506|nr:hypothetical protein [uncultured Modestobacter sp.]